MKAIKIIFVSGVFVLFVGSLTFASITIPNQPWAPPPGGELNLLPIVGDLGIMGRLYGSWVQLDDYTQFWNPDGSATATAKYAGNDETVYYYGTVSSPPPLLLAQYPSGFYNMINAPTVALPHTATGEVFKLKDISAGLSFWSDPALNVADGGAVHAVKFQVLTDLQGNSVSNEYVVAFEDLLMAGSDKDYQDMVIQLNNVGTIPEPVSLIVWSLLGAGWVGLAIVQRRRSAAGLRQA
jgi:hypothetical protein